MPGILATFPNCARAGGAARDQHTPAPQVLSDDVIASLLVRVHTHLQRARCARHKNASLGPLKALLLLLDSHVAAALHLPLRLPHPAAVPARPVRTLSDHHPMAETMTLI